MPKIFAGPVFLVFSRQLFYTGVQSVGVVLLAGLIIGYGFVASFETVLPIGSVRALELLAVLAVRSLGVLITGFVFAARSITAIGAELALLEVTGERTTLERLGVDCDWYLLAPRVLASAVAVAILDLFFIVSALFSAAFALGRRVDVMVIERVDLLVIERVIDSISPAVFFSGLLRAGFFGGLAVWLVGRFGPKGRRAFSDVPVAASAAVLQSIVLLLLLEAAYQVLALQRAS